MKNSPLLAKCLLLFFATAISNHCMARQNKTAVQGTITIMVKDIEYEDASLAELRKAVMGNMKASQVNAGFAAGVAKISLRYQGSATELWDELPQSTKQNFKVTAIDNSHIELKLKTAAKETTTASATAGTEKKNEDCIDCYYFKQCKFDTTREFNGELYRGLKKKTGASLYHCRNGVFSIIYTGINKKLYTQVIFKANDPVGTSWADSSEQGGTYKHVTISKRIGLRYGLQNYYYPDMMIVYGNYGTGFYNYYYAKESGFIKLDTLDRDFNPAIAATLKGIVDTSFAGLWKYYHTGISMNLYYKFEGDGTCRYYAGSVDAINQMPKGVTYWRVNGSSIEMYNSTWASVVKINFQKKNDAGTGRPALLMGTEQDNRIFISEDANKPAWK
jgi:hypothetical protein